MPSNNRDILDEIRICDIYSFYGFDLVERPHLDACRILDSTQEDLRIQEKINSKFKNRLNENELSLNLNEEEII